jgi:sec-independent protein translocase protein TatA
MIVPMIALPLFGISFTEGLVIIIVVLVLFGATRLPKLGKGIGEGIRNFKESLKGDEEASPKIPPTKNDPPSDSTS